MLAAKNKTSGISHSYIPDVDLKRKEWMHHESENIKLLISL